MLEPDCVTGRRAEDGDRGQGPTSSKGEHTAQVQPVAATQKENIKKPEVEISFFFLHEIFLLNISF